MALTRWLFRINTTSTAFLFNSLLLFLVLNCLWRNCYCVENVDGQPALDVSASGLLTEPVLCTENCLDANLTTELRKTCPNIQSQIAKATPIRPDQTAGVLRRTSQANTVDTCAAQCCSTSGCNVAIMDNSTCFMLFCNKGIELCTPSNIFVNSTIEETSTNVSLIFVQTPQPMARKDSVCEQGLEQCELNELCVSKSTRARNGHCECGSNFTWNSAGACIAIPDDDNDFAGTTQSIRSSEPALPESILVTVNSKNVTLPVNEAYLFANVTPQGTIDNAYTYDWLLLSHPENDPATIEGATTNNLKLTGLKPGSYIFQITVRDRGVIGSTNATVTVFPEKRINQSPVAVITPTSQTVQLPTNSAVLDAGSSTDDDKIVSYKWELQKGPIEYTFNPTQNTNSSTLQAVDLIPGNYTFKLTVEDTDHATNSTTAVITVAKPIDYPPTANAGANVIIYLPQTELTLNGNASSDDKKIELWEWKASGDGNKAVDIQDTHTPYLKLSHLEEGMYQFELRVTDEAGQQSLPSIVHVIVKPPSGKPPTANAGSDQNLALPLNWAVLDAAESKSDTKILKWHWSQLSGPNEATIEKPLEIKTNVSGLTKGDYEFQLEVEDDTKLSSKDTVKISVAQKINKSPKAAAGENRTVTLPLSVVYLNGSASSDDVKVTEWKWERQPGSVAAGVFLGNSGSSPVLQLTDLVPGNYTFKLTVKDEQGLSDSDFTKLTVLEDARKRNLVEVIVDIPLVLWTQEDQDKLLQQLSLLIHDKLQLHHVVAQPHTEFTAVVLYGLTDEGETLKGLQLSNGLRQRLQQDPAILSFPVSSIDTVMCLDHCSGHGTCRDFSDGRKCVCDTFWMQNFLKKDFGNTQRNCDWSKIYVSVVFGLLALMFAAVVWSLLYLFRRNLRSIKKGAASLKLGNGLTNGSIRHGPQHKRHHSNKKQYTLLDDDEIELEIKADEADSDTSSDSVSEFEVKRIPKSNSATTTSLLSSSSNGTSRSNGILKHARGVKA